LHRLHIIEEETECCFKGVQFGYFCSGIDYFFTSHLHEWYSMLNELSIKLVTRFKLGVSK